MILNLDDNSESNYVLVKLFLDALRKFGKKKNIESLQYTCDKGLVAKDSTGVFWKIDVNASLIVPEELLMSCSVADEQADFFCVDCDRAVIKKGEIKGLCKICEYIRKA